MHVLVAHGASGGATSMQAHVAGLLARGVDASAIDLPLRKAELAVPAFRERVAQCDAPPERLIVGGRSYGGRVATLFVADHPGSCAGMICFSYPLHRPGVPDWDARSAHWVAIGVPVLFISGGSDPFADLRSLERAIGERLPSARLVTYPRIGHSLKPVLDAALDEAAAFARHLDR